MSKNIVINDPNESVLIKGLEKRTDIKAERIKRLLALPDLTKKQNSPVKILFDHLVNLPKFADFDFAFAIGRDRVARLRAESKNKFLQL